MNTSIFRGDYQVAIEIRDLSQLLGDDVVVGGQK